MGLLPNSPINAVVRCNSCWICSTLCCWVFWGESFWLAVLLCAFIIPGLSSSITDLEFDSFSFPLSFSMSPWFSFKVVGLGRDSSLLSASFLTQLLARTTFILELLPIGIPAELNRESTNGLSLSINCGFEPETGKFRFFNSHFKSLTFMSSSLRITLAVVVWMLFWFSSVWVVFALGDMPNGASLLPWLLLLVSGVEFSRDARTTEDIEVVEVATLLVNWLGPGRVWSVLFF